MGVSVARVPQIEHGDVSTFWGSSNPRIFGFEGGLGVGAGANVDGVRRDPVPACSGKAAAQDGAVKGGDVPLLCQGAEAGNVMLLVLSGLNAVRRRVSDGDGGSRA